MSQFPKYGLYWEDGILPIQIEFYMLRQSDEALNKSGMERYQIYLNIHRILWPEDEQHRWFVLAIKSIVQNKISVFLGCANSGKTHAMSVHALIDFFAFPETSLSLVSSTEMRSLELRIWGRIKALFNRARSRYEWLPGYILESKMSIVSDDVDEENLTARELNRGIVCVPCVSGGRFIGMSKFIGVKPPNTPGKQDGILKHYADEVSLMQPSMLDSYTNWMSNKGFKGVLVGNPTDISDPLCIASEPRGGWDSFEDNGKTQEWKSKWYDANAIAFDGRDTPNMDDGTKDKFPFLASSTYVDELRKTHGEDSWQLYQQGIGKPSKNMVSWRVITIGLCEKHHAFDDLIWGAGERIEIYPLDPAYGGGDRCVGGRMELGKDMQGRQMLYIHEPEVVPIKLNSSLEPEEQIAAYMKNKSDVLGIEASHMFYDSFGRGTLGFSFAKLFGSECPIPIDAGQRPTERPVRFDLFTTELNGTKRLKKCSEHYSKFITEMYFSTREAIESEQVRGLPLSVAQEGQLRMYRIVAGNKIEVESKDDMKERIKKSPDLYDWFAIGVEGARRLGFKIERIGSNVDAITKKGPDWLDKQIQEMKELNKSRRLQNA